MRHKIRHIHFVGIGGAGMCGLAEVMHSLGYQVSGSDAREQPSIAALRACGIQIFIGHAAENVVATDCVVYSGAVAEDNPERKEAVTRGIPVIPRAQMLGEVLRFKPGAAIAGTHGKTTTCSMLAAILAADGRDPTCIIGGQFLDGGGNVRLGGGDFVVVEADESDASFLHLQPVAALITNIDNDHLVAFGGQMEQLQEAFYNFLGNLPFYGAAVICIDDPAAAALAERVSSLRVVSYGFADNAVIRAKDVRNANSANEQDNNAERMGMNFTLCMPEGEYEATLRAAGIHNVQNAVGACAMARELGASVDSMLKGMREFNGIRRRLESHGKIIVQQGSACLLDDYAHHPTEIAATIAAVRGARPTRRLLLVFQPHRYTRTRDVFADMIEALALADALILLDVYPAGETPLAGADSQSLVEALQKNNVNVVLAGGVEEAVATVQQKAQDGDIVLTMGAGDVGSLPALLKKKVAA